MQVTKVDRELLTSDTLTYHRLKAAGLAKRLKEFWTIQAVCSLTNLKNSFDWTDPEALGIEPDAWGRIKKKRIEPVLVFCHPRVISEQPQLLLYYRTVALLSQKGLRTLVGGNVARIEAGNVEKLDSNWIAKTVVAINSILSAIVLTAADIDGQDLPGFQFAAIGATIQGSWNNAIGAEGESAVKTILLNNLRDEIRQIVWRDGSCEAYKPKKHSMLIDRISDVRVVRLKKGFHIVFSSEPDISLRNPKDMPAVAIEIKAGSDPAGALERLGAAMKSFENERNLNPRVKTVYVVRSLTPEAQRRISQTKPFDYTFGLSELLADQKTQKVFANMLLRIVLGK